MIKYIFCFAIKSSLIERYFWCILVAMLLADCNGNHHCPIEIIWNVNIDLNEFNFFGRLVGNETMDMYKLVYKDEQSPQIFDKFFIKKPKCLENSFGLYWLNYMNKLNYGNGDAVRWRDSKRMANKLEKRKCSVKETNVNWQTIYMSLDGRRKKNRHK